MTTRRTRYEVQVFDADSSAWLTIWATDRSEATDKARAICRNSGYGGIVFTGRIREEAD